MLKNINKNVINMCRNIYIKDTNIYNPGISK